MEEHESNGEAVVDGTAKVIVVMLDWKLFCLYSWAPVMRRGIFLCALVTTAHLDDTSLIWKHRGRAGGASCCAHAVSEDTWTKIDQMAEKGDMAMLIALRGATL
jgi:hypothetical protein